MGSPLKRFVARIDWKLAVAVGAASSVVLAAISTALQWPLWVGLIPAFLTAAVTLMRAFLERRESTLTQMERWQAQLRVAIVRQRTRNPQSQLSQMVPQGTFVGPRAREFKLTEGSQGTSRFRVAGRERSLEDITTEWDRSPDRLIIVGEPGYGKTVTALVLLAHINADGTPGRPVAELFPLAEWYRWHTDHPGTPLDRWLAEQLTTTYRISLLVARRLVDEGRIVPIFDGLDEVPSTDRLPCTEAIEGYSGRIVPFRPFILTSRAREYREQGSNWESGVKELVLVGWDEQQIEQIIASHTKGRSGWAPIREALARHDQRLLTLLGSPLRLSVVLQAFRDRDPAELLHRDPRSLETYLWDLVLGLGDPSFRGADPNTVRSWLTFVAAGMTGHSSQVFRLHELYDYAPRRPVEFQRFRTRLGVSVGAASTLAVGVAEAIGNGLVSGHVTNGILNGVVGGALFGPVFGALAAGGTQEAPKVREPLALSLRQSWRWALGASVWGAFVGLANGFSKSANPRLFANRVANGLASALLLGIAFGLVGWVARFLFAGSSQVVGDPPKRLAVRGPGAVLAASRDRWLVFMLGGALAGTALGATAGTWLDGIVFGLFASLLAALVGGLGAFLYHYHLRRLLAKKELLPRKLPEFLNWCASPERGWLRVTDGYEFRHRELLDHVASMHPSPS